VTLRAEVLRFGYRDVHLSATAVGPSVAMRECRDVVVAGVHLFAGHGARRAVCGAANTRDCLVTHCAVSEHRGAGARGDAPRDARHGAGTVCTAHCTLLDVTNTRAATSLADDERAGGRGQTRVASLRRLRAAGVLLSVLTTLLCVALGWAVSPALVVGGTGGGASARRFGVAFVSALCTAIALDTVASVVAVLASAPPRGPR
jgi:hypothetical protein